MFTRTRLSLILSSVAAIVLTAAMAFGSEIEIRDPHHELQGPFFYGHRPAFAQSFTCNQPVSIFTKAGQCKIFCEFGGCEQKCTWTLPVETKYNPEECGPEQVSIYSSLGAEITVLKSDYEASANSMALTIIKFLSTFYEHIEVISIDQTVPTPNKALIENGKINRLFLTTLALSVFPDRNKPESVGVMLTLDLNRAGLDQVMCLTDNGFCDPNQGYFLKRKGLVNATF